MFPWVTIVGVASDVRCGGLEAAPEPTIYQPLAQTPGPSLSVVVRSNGNPRNLMSSIRFLRNFGAASDAGFPR
jgi:hypothetical protein